MDREIARVVHDVAKQVVTAPRECGLALDGDRQHVGGIDEADGVTVGCRPGQFTEADGAAGAWLVRHDDLGAVAYLDFKIVCKQAHDEVGAAPGRIGDDQVDGPVRISAGVCGCTDARDKRHGDGA